MLIPQWQMRTPIRGSSPWTPRSSGKDHFCDLCPPRLGEEGGRLGGRSAGLGNGLRDILWILKDPADKNSRLGGAHTIQGRILAKTEPVRVDPQTLGQFLRFGMGLKPHGKDHQIEFFVLKGIALINISDLQIVRLGILGHPRDQTPHIADPVVFFGPFVIPVEALALGPDINKKNGRLDGPPHAPWR